LLTQSERINWIPDAFQDAARNLAKDAIKRFLRKNQVIGLGSGPMAAAIVEEMANFDGKETLECIPSSFQIKLEAERSGLRIIDESRIPEIELVFDGADEIDGSFDMIKGGGGALFREKVLHTAAKQVIITAESKKFVPLFTWPVPIEVHPFAIDIVKEKLQDYGGSPRMRMLKEGYPYVTQNGNFILDTAFKFSPSDEDNTIKQQEIKLKSIAGVIEVGLFTSRKGIFYKAKTNGSFESIEKP
jgi:ribose 5-phosphate isomerase A